MNMKNKGTRAIILKDVIKDIKYIIKNNEGVYSSEEIDKISKQYNRTQNEFLKTAFGKTYKIYKKRLEEQGEIYIGEGRLSNLFIEKYGNFLMQQAKNINDSDIEEEVIIYSIDNLSYVEKNFKGEGEILKVLKSEIQKVANQIIVEKYYEEKSKLRLDSEVNFYTAKGEKDKIERQIKDEKVDVHKQVMNLVS